MTSYWKPRWPHPVLFGSYRELNYRIDLSPDGKAGFWLQINAGPGFSLELRRGAASGFQVLGPAPPPGSEDWLEHPECQPALADLLRQHFSQITIQPDAVICYCHPGEDLLPEGAQLTWCLDRLYRLWQCAPAARRRRRPLSEFLA